MAKEAKRRWSIAGVHKLSYNLGSQLKIVGTQRVTGSKFHPEDPQSLGATVQSVFVRAPWIYAPPSVQISSAKRPDRRWGSPSSPVKGYRGVFARVTEGEA
jgi:hypothetical protein